MGRLYINSDEAKITHGDAYTVNLELFGGGKYENLEPRCLFPITGPGRYISLLTDKNEEIAVIRNVDNLMPESKKVINEVLKEYYLIPKITRILDRSRKIWYTKMDGGHRQGCERD